MSYCISGTHVETIYLVTIGYKYFLFPGKKQPVKMNGMVLRKTVWRPNFIKEELIFKFMMKSTYYFYISVNIMPT